MWILTIFLLFLVYAVVQCQLDANQVYQLLSSRIHLENNLLRSELNKLDEKIGAKEDHINKRLDDLSARIQTLESEHGKQAREMPKTTNQEEANNYENNNPSEDTDKLSGEIMRLKYAFQNEKQYVRRMNSIISDQTSSLQQNLVDVKEKVRENSNGIRQLNDTTEKEFVSVQDTLTELDSVHNTLKGRLDLVVANQNSMMKQDIESAKNTFAGLESTQNALTSRVDHVESKLNSLNQDIDAAKNRLTGLDSAKNTLVRRVDQIVSKQNSLSQDMENNQRSLDVIKNRQNRRNIAFNAELSSTTPNLAVGAKVVFDHVLFQDGNGFNPNTGEFTCPETGVYMFTVVLANENSGKRSIVARLYKGTLKKAIILSESFQTGQNDQSSNTAIFRLYRGTKVWVEVESPGNAIVRRWQSTFSGVLLYN